MFRSMMLVCAINALSAIGCVAANGTADESAVADNTGRDPFDCENVASISGVECIGSISFLNRITVNVYNAALLDDNKKSVLAGDLNDLSVKDVNVLDGYEILRGVYATVLDDFLNKFNIYVNNRDVSVCAVGICYP